MNKEQFLDRLNDRLQNLSRKDREDILYDMMEHFENGKREGKTERQIINDLGNPEYIAKGYTIEASDDQNEPIKRENLRSPHIVTIIAVIAINVMFVLGPAIAIAAVFFSFYIVAFAVVYGPVHLFIQALISGGGNTVVLFFFVLFTVSLGMLMFAGLSKLGRLLKGLLGKYIALNKRIIRGERLT
ncbi:HAAS signaling domain-containing protein [Bacillaceae bacterium W0354]